MLVGGTGVSGCENLLWVTESFDDCYFTLCRIVSASVFRRDLTSSSHGNSDHLDSDHLLRKGSAIRSATASNGVTKVYWCHAGTKMLTVIWELSEAWRQCDRPRNTIQHLLLASRYSAETIACESSQPVSGRRCGKILDARLGEKKFLTACGHVELTLKLLLLTIHTFILQHLLLMLLLFSTSELLLFWMGSWNVFYFGKRKVCWADVCKFNWSVIWHSLFQWQQKCPRRPHARKKNRTSFCAPHCDVQILKNW